MALRREGWVTLLSFDRDVDASVEAARLGCSHVFANGEPRAVAATVRAED
jgi:hypothetical protein